MQEFPKSLFSKLFRRTATALTILLAAACQQLDARPVGAARSAAADAITQQLLIKFKPNTVACTAAAMTDFSASVGMVLHYVRPLSGDACVVRHVAGNETDAAQELQLLKQHPAIEWAEVDAVLRAS